MVAPAIPFAQYKPLASSGSLPKREILANGHMGIQGIVLKHHRDITIFREDCYHSVADDDIPGRLALQPGNHAQGSGFAAPEGPTKTTNSLSLITKSDPLQR